MKETPRRILVALSGSHELHLTIETAVTFAAGFGTSLQCVIIEQEDLVTVAGLPFARIFGRGGMSSAVTLEGVASYFRRLEQTVEHELIERCKNLNVSWSLTRPQGDYLRELMSSVERGDVVVVSRKDAHVDPGALVAIFNSILEKASAVVIPAATLPPGGNVLALPGVAEDGNAVALARDIATASGRGLIVVPLTEFLATRRHAAIVVAPIALADAAGADVFLRAIEIMGAAAVLV
jgi:hypothetical protein